jgi:hypothetical protein
MKSTAIIIFAIIFSSFAIARIAAGFGGGKVQNAIKSNDTNIWGNAVNGVAVRLVAKEKVWTTNEVPSFQVIVRNNDVEAHGYLTAWQPANRLEVDDVWYAWDFGGRGNVGMGTLPPNEEARSDVTFDPHWRSAKTKESLQILPGKHTVRFAVELLSVSPLMTTNIISNPVEIEVKNVGTSIAPTNHI